MKTLILAWVLASYFTPAAAVQQQMERLQPHDAYGVTWGDTYADTAESIAQAAEEHPLFRGPRGAEETADLLVSLGWFESKFDPHAVGDGGGSCGLFQISPKTGGVSCAALQDPRVAAGVALRLIRQSRSICRKEPEDRQLAWYAKGGGSCREDGFVLSEHRMGKAKALFREHPFALP